GYRLLFRWLCPSPGLRPPSPRSGRGPARPKFPFIVWSAVLLLATSPGVARQSPAVKPAAAAASPSAQDVRATINQYCVTCHNQRIKTANLELDTKDVNRLETDTVAWEAVVRKLRTGMMPPKNAPRPDRATLDATAGWL